MAELSTLVWTRVDLPGFHRWPDAPDGRGYLRDRHRHLFRVTISVRVSSDDREVEFHDLADALTAWWSAKAKAHGDGVLCVEWGDKSCEAIAKLIVADWQVAAGARWMRVEVSEDGQSGAIVEVTP